MTNKLPQRLAWLLPLGLLAAGIFGAVLIQRLGTGIFGWIFAGLVGLGLLWIVVSVLWPARAERTCPDCGRPGLVRLDTDLVHGLECTQCDYRDETASAWLLAEEEGPLEELVLAQRAQRRERGHSPLDTARSPD